MNEQQVKNNNLSEKLSDFFLPFFAEKLQILIDYYHRNVEQSSITLEEYLLMLCEEIGEEKKTKVK